MGLTIFCVNGRKIFEGVCEDGEKKRAIPQLTLANKHDKINFTTEMEVSNHEDTIPERHMDAPCRMR